MNIKTNKNIKFQESKSNFTFDFKGENEIDVLTLSTTMNNVVGILRIITINIEPEAYIKVKVSAMRKGSINFDLSAIVGSPWNLIINQIIDVAGKVITGLLTILAIKKHLEGKKPLSINYKKDKALIQNYKGIEIVKPKEITDIYFNNYKIDNSIVNIFTSLDKDSDRENLIIEKDNIKELEVNKKEFPDMAEMLIEPQGGIMTKKDEMKIDLLIKNIDFGDKKWEFWFMGKRIEAKIKDEEWKQKVNKGEIGNFTSGDKLPVRLIAEYDIDERGNIIEGTERFEITKVTGKIIKKPDQRQINFKDEK